MLLRLDNVQRHFGGVHAVDGVSLEIEQGSIYGLIGPNGAGKTTLVNVVTGYVPFQSGRAWLESDELTGRPAHRIAALGISRTFQNIRLFKDLTAQENVLIGMHARRHDDTLAQLATLPMFRRDQLSRLEEAHRLMETVGLNAKNIGKRSAGTLPYGDQRRLEIARALALKPRLLILDEPAAGMNPSEKQGMRELIENLNKDGLTVLLIDHDMRLVMGVCTRVAVLNFGKKIADSTPKEVSTDAGVIKAYLGTGGEREVSTAPGASGVDEAMEVVEAVATATVAAEPEHAMLDVRDLSVSYGAVNAVRGASLRVARGEVVALIGANGAGKSTILNTLSGLLRPSSGTATFDGLDLTVASPSAIVRRGLIQVPEGREILARQTVLENLELATWARRDGGAANKEIEAAMRRFPILGERRALRAGNLSGGEQQMLAIARGLLAKPRLLLLDEPSLGLAPQMVDEVFAAIEEIHKDGTTILLVEQNALRALAIADRAYVIETGQILLTGSGDELLHNPAVRRAYLGG
ncbi:MAG: branched-chain amino acid transport system ATP-binding protein [Chloroflexota bacterium]|nr:branched-chain amino acid transport system ATP-binding protein [Chloroflexota bacterium]